MNYCNAPLAIFVNRTLEILLWWWRWWWWHGMQWLWNKITEDKALSQWQWLT